jgi:hypothetical protein
VDKENKAYRGAVVGYITKRKKVCIMAPVFVSHPLQPNIEIRELMCREPLSLTLGSG